MASQHVQLSQWYNKQIKRDMCVRETFGGCGTDLLAV